MIFRSFTHFLGIYLFVFRILEKENCFRLVGRLSARGLQLRWASSLLRRPRPGWRPTGQRPRQPGNWTRGRAGARSLCPQPVQWRGQHRLTVVRGAARCAGWAPPGWRPLAGQREGAGGSPWRRHGTKTAEEARRDDVLRQWRCSEDEGGGARLGRCHGPAQAHSADFDLNKYF
jgi:hypothetical protein